MRPLAAVLLLAALLADGRASAQDPGKTAPDAVRVSGKVRYVGEFRPADPVTVDEAMRKVCGHEVHEDLRCLRGEDQGVANALILLRPKEGTHPPRAPIKAELEKRGCRIEPRVLVARKGASIVFRNVDSPCLGFAVASRRNGQVNWMHRAGEESTHTFEHAEIVPITCPVRPDMRAWVALVDEPYFAVSGAGGEFDLGEIPAGVYEVVVWHELTGYAELAREMRWLEIEAGQPVRIALEFSRKAPRENAPK